LERGPGERDACTIPHSLAARPDYQ
jgi:hypothetical protein